MLALPKNLQSAVRQCLACVCRNGVAMRLDFGSSICSKYDEMMPLFFLMISFGTARPFNGSVLVLMLMVLVYGPLVALAGGSAMPRILYGGGFAVL